MMQSTPPVLDMQPPRPTTVACRFGEITDTAYNFSIITRVILSWLSSICMELTALRLFINEVYFFYTIYSYTISILCTLLETKYYGVKTSPWLAAGDYL